MTSRGLKEDDMSHVATLIADIIDNLTDAAVHARVAKEVLVLTQKFPLYPELG
jgi:glycine hydroxymethyltransferase